MSTIEPATLLDAPMGVPTEAQPYREPFGALAHHIKISSSGDQSALRRLNPEALQPKQMAALARALIAAELPVEKWHADVWPRWALIAHGIALAGHNDRQKLGSQLAKAGVSESRVTKLLTLRGDAFMQVLPRVLRLLASKDVKPNWRELGELVLIESSNQRHHQVKAEEIRLQIARFYFSEIARPTSQVAATAATKKS